jgi:hypothetical protein
MPHVTVYPGAGDNPIYQVGGKSFVFFRNPRPDAVDPETGERYVVRHRRVLEAQVALFVNEPMLLPVLMPLAPAAPFRRRTRRR